MKIQVTDGDIKNGRRFVPLKCPIGLACQRAMPDNQSFVGNHTVSVWAGDVRIGDCELPQVARDFVRDFDMTKPVQPFEFELGELVK